MIIDAHHHLWDIRRPEVTWPGPDLATIHRPFDMDDLAAAAPALDGTVLVQSQPDYRDTLWLVEQAATHPLVKAVVGWVQMDDPLAAGQIAWLARQPKFRGLRPMLQGLDDDEWVLRSELNPAFQAMLDHGLSFDALVFTRHLPVIEVLAGRWPGLTFIIDHGAKPPIGDAAATALWREAITRVATLPNVACKLSGLITEAPAGAGFDAVAPYADHLLAAFGADRLMWGSDWPVLNLRGDYRGWHDWTDAWLADKPVTEQFAIQSAILGETARRLYRIGETA